MKKRLPLPSSQGLAPGILLLAAAVLFGRYPYACYSSDMSMYGFMARDLSQTGYLPSFVYGSDYLFGYTAYLVALVRVLTAGKLSNLGVLVLGGVLTSFAGVVLLFLGLRWDCQRTQRPCVAALAGFSLLIASNGTLVFSMENVSSSELVFFCLGVTVLCLARLESCLDRSAAVPRWLAALTGWAVAYDLIARPQVFIYAAVGLAVMSLGALRQGRARPRWGLVALFVGGLALGYLPQLLHDLLRAPTWPVAGYRPALALAGRSEMERQFGVAVFEVLPWLFGLEHWSPWFALGSLLILGLATGRSVQALCHLLEGRREGPGLVAASLTISSLILLVLMVTVPHLAVDRYSVRYYLALPITAYWLVCDWGASPPRSRLVLGLAILCLGSSLPQWRDRLAQAAGAAERWTQGSADLARLDQDDLVYLAPYWVADALDYLRDSHPKLQTYPFDAVRRFGAYREELLRGQVAWLLTPERFSEVRGLLARYTGELVVSGQVTLAGQSYLVALNDSPTAYRKLLDRYCPDYLDTRYPPGSGPPPADPGPLPAPVTLCLKVGSPAARSHLLAGWSQSEGQGEESFVWSDGPQSMVGFQLAPVAAEYTLAIDGLSYQPPLSVQVDLNGRRLGEMRFDGGRQARYLEFPATALARGLNRLGLHYSSWVAPKDVEASIDTRHLALRVYGLWMLPRRHG